LALKPANISLRGSNGCACGGAHCSAGYPPQLEQIVVAARKTGSGFGAGELAEQLMVDIQKYQQHPDCRTLICFVYDPEGRIANPRGLENDLSGDKNGLTVRVIIAPKGL
jgi:hypothetical protein